MKTLFSFLSFNLFALLFSTASAQLYWSDSFGSYASGTPLHNKGRWVVQNEPLTGYMVQSSAPLTYTNLLSDANYATGGNSFFAAGVSFPIEEGSPLYTNHVSDLDPTKVGFKTGSSNVLWYSMLVRADGIDNFVASFHGRGGQFSWWNDTWNLGIIRGAWSHEWGIIINNDQRIFSSSTSENGATALIVLKFQFEADGIVINLYVNPTPGTEPATPAVSGKTTSITGFTSVQQYIGFNENAYSIDEVRLGETYASVTPQDTSTKVIKTIEKNPVIYTAHGSIVADLSAIDGKCSMQVFDMKGVLMKNLNIYGGNKVQISNLKSGIYMVKVSKGITVFNTKVVL